MVEQSLREQAEQAPAEKREAEREGTNWECSQPFLNGGQKARPANLLNGWGSTGQKKWRKIVVEVINEPENTYDKCLIFHTLENVPKSILMYKITISEEN